MPLRSTVVIHGRTSFLSGEGRNADYDQERFTRANVAYSRATDLTILVCPVITQGMTGALQVLAALLHGVQTVRTSDTGNDLQLTSIGELNLHPAGVREDTEAFANALQPRELWTGPLPVCLVEHHAGRARRLRLVLPPNRTCSQRRLPPYEKGLISQVTPLGMASCTDTPLIRSRRRSGLSFLMHTNRTSGGCFITTTTQGGGAV